MAKEERELSIEYLEKIKEDYIEGNAYERHPLPEYYAIEHAIKALDQEPCEDAVSRKAVINTIYAECAGAKLDIDFAKVLLLQRVIKALPSVTPQEPLKPMVEIDLYSVIKQKYIEREVLNKISAEIEQLRPNLRPEQMTDYDYAMVDAVNVIVAIIDKYKAESE